MRKNEEKYEKIQQKDEKCISVRHPKAGWHLGKQGFSYIYNIKNLAVISSKHSWNCTQHSFTSKDITKLILSYSITTTP